MFLTLRKWRLIKGFKLCKRGNILLEGGREGGVYSGVGGYQDGGLSSLSMKWIMQFPTKKLVKANKVHYLEN